MSDRDPEGRIRDLKKRVEREPGSRFFVPLAEEYRRAGRISDALRTLEEGLVSHPSYVAARVGLARAYLEAGRTEESMAAFSKALADDPSNLVAAKALGDLHLSRGEPVQALKRYLRYRGISGDRRLDSVIARLQAEVSPPPDSAPPGGTEPPPPPPSFRNTPLVGTAPPPLPPELAKPYGSDAAAAPPPRETDAHDISGITYERPAVHFAAAEDPGVPSRDLSLDAIHAAARSDDEIVTRKIRLPEATWPFEPAAAAVAATPEEPAPEPAPPPANEPGGRALADLYFEQGHFAEARSLYEDLLAAAPADEPVRRLRDEAARKAEAEPLQLPAGDPSRELRLARVRVLNEWIAAVRANSDSKPEPSE
jgi:tetratricopeptide (TPR) repeat protein